MHPLPQSTRSHLRSTQIIPSLPHLIAELIQNALDASATQIDVGVDCAEWGCWVRDNGSGMSKEGMAILAMGQGGRYSTSKAYDSASLDEVSTFGFRGEALASAADLSCLEISSRTLRSRESWSVILKGGEVLYNGASIRWRRESHGTVVCIRDAFYNLPIRRLSHSAPARTLELIRRDLETCALMFPNVAFTLENVAKEREAGNGKGRVMSIPKTSSTLSAFKHLYGRALVDHVDEINVSSGELKLEGFLSLEGAHSKGYQFLFVNRHLLAQCDLHRIIEGQFATTSFAKHAYDEAGETKYPRPASRRSPRKTEKKPVYVLNLTVPPRRLDNCLEPTKAAMHFQNSDALSSFLSSVVQDFLSRHGFVAHVDTELSHMGGRKDGSPSPRKRRKVMYEDMEVSSVSRPAANINRSVNETGITINSSSGHPVIHRNAADTDEDTQEEVIWTDPNTGEIFVVDTRTGNSYPKSLGAESSRAEEDKAHSNRRLVDTRWLKKPIDGEATAIIPEWIQQALRGNNAYALTEPKIPILSLSSDFASDMDFHYCSHDLQNSFQRPSSKSSVDARAMLRHFSRTDLMRARVISQVDRKFIACLIDNDTPSTRQGEQEGMVIGSNSRGKTLVLVDQHAADERVRVERFLKDLCLGFLRDSSGNGSGRIEDGVKTKEVAPRFPVLLTSREREVLAKSAGVQCALGRWGIRFSDLASTGEHDGVENDGVNEESYCQVFVEAVPEVLHDKLMHGDELRQLIKGYLARVEDEGVLSLPQLIDGTPADQTFTEFAWLKALRWCPRELVDLLNSKACRGAIMFNDTLTMEQCRQLLARLAETAFPFQCAHGRPSLVPLTNVGGLTGTLAGYSARDIEWTGLEL